MWGALIGVSGSLAICAGAIIYVVKKLAEAHKGADEAHRGAADTHVKLLAERMKIFELESRILKHEAAEATLTGALASRGHELDLESKARKDLEKRNAELVTKLAHAGRSE